MDSLSWRDKSLVRAAIAEKMVDKICTGLINNAPLVDNLRESLGNEMLKVLSDPANKSKISQTVVGAVNTSIELPLRGPLLLYALMENDESYNYTKNMITFIFGQIYENEDTLGKFSSRLVERLYDPPYDSWFGNVNKISGGKKRKTKRKISKRRRNKMKSKRKYSRKRKMYGGVDQSALIDAAGMDPGALIDAAKSAGMDPSALKDADTDALTDALTNTADSTGTEEGAGEGTEEGAEEGAAEEDAEEEGAAEEGNNESGKKDTSSSASSGNASSMFSSGAQKREMTGSEITQNADELVSKYNDALFKLISKDLETIKSQLLQRMLNACYLHATNNSNIVLESITKAVGDIVRQSMDNGMNNGIMQYDFPSFILLVQAMRPSSRDITDTLSSTYVDQKEKDSKAKFNPTDSTFIVDFMDKFKLITSKKINMDLPGSD